MDCQKTVIFQSNIEHLAQVKNEHKIIIDGTLQNLTEPEIIDIIKRKLMNSKVVQNLFYKNKVSLDNIKQLNIEFVALNDEYGLTDDKIMKINKELLNDENFFSRFLFVFFHEIVHYCLRLKENRGWLHDPEESLSVIISIAHYYEIGKSTQDIWVELFPKIKDHFGKEQDAESFFKRCLIKAKTLV